MQEWLQIWKETAVFQKQIKIVHISDNCLGIGVFIIIVNANRYYTSTKPLLVTTLSSTFKILSQFVLSREKKRFVGVFGTWKY